MNITKLKDRIEYRNDAGELHRAVGPAGVYICGSRYWYVNGFLHRTNGPAVELADGYKAWYINGVKHRDDGPAVVRASGTKRILGEWG